MYNFACHPIQGVPGGGNTADLVGFASRAIEAGCPEGTTALFLQGCAGDVNPVGYKDVEHPPDAETLGNLLGLAVLRALPSIRAARTARLRLLNARMALPRADLAPWVAALEQERDRLVDQLTGTTLNLRTFLQLAARHGLSPQFPSGYAYRYLHERALGRGDLSRLDAGNRQALAEYVDRVHTMEQLIRLRTNLDLLRLHAAHNQAAGGAPVEVEVCGLRVGRFVLLTFPGELSVEIGLDLKRASPHRPTFVAAYTNGCIYYAPTAAQLRQRGLAQEDSDCFLAPQWQALFEAEAGRLLRRL